MTAERDLEQQLRDAAAARGFRVEFHEWAEDRAPISPTTGERSPFRYRLMVESDEHRGVAGIAWRTPEERDASIRWALEAISGWPAIPHEAPAAAHVFMGVRTQPADDVSAFSPDAYTRTPQPGDPIGERLEYPRAAEDDER